MSKKHSGRMPGGIDQNNRSAPYCKNQRKVFVKEGWTGNQNPVSLSNNSSGGGSLRCNVCGVSANSALQLQQHNYSKKHQDKLNQRGSEPMETTQQYPSVQAPPPLMKKSWLNSHNDIGGGGSYSYRGPGSTGGNGGYSMNVYPKWSSPSYQRVPHGGYNHRY